MTENGKICHLVAAALLAASLAGCTTSGGSPDDKMGRLLVAPDKFVLYSCAELAERATTIAERQRELEGLMAKAGADAGGRLVSSIAYRPEYIEHRGEMNELRAAAAAKNCKLPAMDTPGGRASDKAGR